MPVLLLTPEMHRGLPPELVDHVLDFAYPKEMNSWTCTKDPSFPLDSRSKSPSFERLLRSPPLRFTRRSCPAVKELRLILPHFFTNLLFTTLLLYPHEDSFAKLKALSVSRLRGTVRHVVISLPFFTSHFLHSSTWQNEALLKLWIKIPPGLHTVLQHFPNLHTITILPSWDRRS